jgi:hypothetical protein
VLNIDGRVGDMALLMHYTNEYARLTDMEIAIKGGVSDRTILSVTALQMVVGLAYEKGGK